MRTLDNFLKLIFTLMLIISISLVIASCDNDADEPKPPVIDSFSPGSGFPGEIITITGSNFHATAAHNAVKFNGVDATLNSAGKTELVVIVPAGAITGKITVTVGGATATSASDFIVSQTITGFSPTSGIIGTTVTITGLNFDATAANNVVKFNGATAAVTAATTTQLTVTVPASATTGKITVTTNGVTSSSANDFTVLEPAITDFSPASGVVGTSVTINGSNFSTVVGDNVVKFNDVSATVSSATSTQIVAVVPAAAVTGKITVTANGKTTTSATDFTVPVPAIASYFPAIAAAGRSVVIAGTNFSSAVENNIVKFNGVEASVTAASATELTVTVPAGGAAGAITVKVGPHTATAVGNFEICAGAPELVISDIVLGGTSGTSFSIRFKLTNVGSMNADVTKMSMQNYASVDAAVGNDVGASGFSLTNGGTLAPGQSYTTPNFICNISGGNKTSHPYLIVTIYDSPDGAVPECNIANNVVIRPF